MAIDQRLGRSRVEPAHVKLREPGGLEASDLALAGGEEHRDAFRIEAPGDKDKCVRRRVVEPLRIVDEAQERLAFGGLGEQAERRERDEEGVVASSRRQPERSSESSGLRLRKVIHVAQDGQNDLVQCGERKMRLRFDAAAAQNEHVAGSVARVLQECRLADARLAGEDQDSALRRSSAGEELADTGALQVSPVEHLR